MQQIASIELYAINRESIKSAVAALTDLFRAELFNKYYVILVPAAMGK